MDRIHIPNSSHGYTVEGSQTMAAATLAKQFTNSQASKRTATVRAVGQARGLNSKFGGLNFRFGDLVTCYDLRGTC